MAKKKKSDLIINPMEAVKVYSSYFIQSIHVHVKSESKTMTLCVSCAKFGPLVQFYSTDVSKPYFKSFSQKHGSEDEIMELIRNEYDLPLEVQNGIVNYLKQKTRNVKATMVPGNTPKASTERGDADVWGT